VDVSNLLPVVMASTYLVYYRIEQYAVYLTVLFFVPFYFLSSSSMSSLLLLCSTDGLAICLFKAGMVLYTLDLSLATTDPAASERNSRRL
jgi:hypothetical protein